VLVLASVGAVLILFSAVSDPDVGGFVLVVCLGVIAALAGWALASWNPTVVSIRDGVLGVARGGQEDEFDLRDPETRVELGQRPGSPSWRARVIHAHGSSAVIGARQVKPRHFIQVVQHHRAHLRAPEKTTADG
jgi:hypothetical protein